MSASLSCVQTCEVGGLGFRLRPARPARRASSSAASSPTDKIELEKGASPVKRTTVPPAAVAADSAFSNRSTRSLVPNGSVGVLSSQGRLQRGWSQPQLGGREGSADGEEGADPSVSA